MKPDRSNMTCQQFQDQLPELIGSGENAASHPHLQTCALCRALLSDLEIIAAAARQLFPIVEPPDDLWEHIESALKDEDGAPEPLDKGSSRPR
ncbi:MAG: hypothetical protein ABSE87_03505 [Terracidiphilus sp.]|jgi:hypothetical protein